MMNNFTSKAVIVAITLAVISLSALETSADTRNIPHYLNNTIEHYEHIDEDVLDYIESQSFENDVVCLARNIYYESRGEPIDGQEWVAWVTLNRVNHDRYPSSICSVVHQCNRNNVCQFSWVRSNRHARPRDRESWERSVEIAVSILLQEKFGDTDDPTEGAIMFHADNVRPRWRHSYQVVDQIGSHIFYREQS